MVKNEFSSLVLRTVDRVDRDDRDMCTNLGAKLKLGPIKYYNFNSLVRVLHNVSGYSGVLGSTSGI